MDALKVFIADDDKDILNILMMHIDKQDDMHVVRTATDGKSAYEYIKDILPDVCILDIMMSVWDGVETLRRLKEDGSADDIIIFMLSADNKPEVVKRIMDLGGYYRLKPFDIDLLIREIRQAYEDKKAFREIERRAKISTILSECGIYPRFSGHGYLIHIIERVLKNPYYRDSLKDIYSDIANMTGKTQKNVECLVGHAIEVRTLETKY